MYDFELIIDTMHQKRVTVAKLCELTDLSHETIARIRKGENVSIANLGKVASALEIPISNLVRDAA